MKSAFFVILTALIVVTPALAAPETPPILLSDCHFAAFSPTARDGDPNITQLRALWVDFRNAGAATVTAITFDAVKYGEHLVVTDKGRFTKGATVTHQLLGYVTAWKGDRWADSCRVSSAQFADGSIKAY